MDVQNVVRTNFSLLVVWDRGWFLECPSNLQASEAVVVTFKIEVSKVLQIT